MQYLVKVSGDVEKTSVESEVYVIKADSEEEAQQKALNNFSKQRNIVDDNVIVDNVSRRNSSTIIISILLMIISILLCTIVSFHNGREVYSLRPDLISSIFSIILFFVYFIKFKGLSNLKNSIYDILSAITMIVLFSCLFKIILNSKDIYILGLIRVTVDTRFFLLTGLLLSFVGFGTTSGIILIITMVLSLGNILSINEAMGIWGAILAITSLFGVALNISADPVSERILEMISFTKGGMSKISNRTSQTISDIKQIEKNRTNIVNAKIEKAEVKKDEKK